MCHQATQAAEDGGRTAMENCLSKNPDINVVYTINEPAAFGAYKALQTAGKTQGVTIATFDGSCRGMAALKKGMISVDAQTYPAKMAELGIQAAVAYAKDKSIPKPSPGLTYFDPGIALVTDTPVSASIRLAAMRAANRASDLNRNFHWGRRILANSVATPRTAGEEFAKRRRSPAQQIQHYIHRHPWVSPLVALALSVTVFAILAPTFRTPHNLSLVLQQASVLATVSAGQALVVLSGGIDLSVGVVMVLSTLVIGKLVVDVHAPGPLALLVGLVVGGVAGCVNGYFAAYLKMNPFIVTLATLSIFGAMVVWCRAARRSMLRPSARF